MPQQLNAREAELAKVRGQLAYKEVSLKDAMSLFLTSNGRTCGEAVGDLREALQLVINSGSTDAKFNELEEKIDKLNKEIDKLKKEIERLEDTKIKELKAEIAALQAGERAGWAQGRSFPRLAARLQNEHRAISHHVLLFRFKFRSCCEARLVDAPCFMICLFTPSALKPSTALGPV